MGIAARLFDLTASQHGLPPAFRRLLRIGVLVHDVGRTGGIRPLAPYPGAKMILANRSLPDALRRTRDGRLPDAIPSEDRPQQGRDPPGLRPARCVCLARAAGHPPGADALDSRRVVSSAPVMRLAGRRLRVKCFVNGDPVRAERAFNNNVKFRMLEETLGVSAKVQLRRYTAAGV